MRKVVVFARIYAKLVVKRYYFGRIYAKRVVYLHVVGAGRGAAGRGAGGRGAAVDKRKHEYLSC